MCFFGFEIQDFGGASFQLFQKIVQLVETSMDRKKPTVRNEKNLQPAGSKSKKAALVIEDDEYSIGTELSEECQVEEEKDAVTGKDKKENSKASQRRDDDLDDVGKVDEGDNEVPQVAFTGKKKGKSKKSGGNSVFSTSSFGLLGDEDEGVENDEKSGLKRRETWGTFWC